MASLPSCAAVLPRPDNTTLPPSSSPCVLVLHPHLPCNIRFTRRLLGLLGGFALHGLSCDPAHAFSLGISGPKDWLKGQKKKTAEFLLAPILASRDRLKDAFSLIQTSSLGDLLEADKLVKVAARDCIKPKEASFTAFQVKTGVEVCTFRLILKNAASLLDDSDPTKLSADAALNNLISSFTSLDGIVSTISSGVSSMSDSVADAFNKTNNDLDTFERSIRDCLGIS